MASLTPSCGVVFMCFLVIHGLSPASSPFVSSAHFLRGVFLDAGYVRSCRPPHARALVGYVVRTRVVLSCSLSSVLLASSFVEQTF